MLIALQAMAAMEEEDHPHLRINLETCTTPLAMVEALVNALNLADALNKESPRWKESLKGLKERTFEQLSNIEEVSVNHVGSVSFRKNIEDWRKPAEVFFKQLMAHDGPLTFLLDEFPIFVDAAAKENRDGCEAMLRWFREWRQRTADTGIRFLVTGSIGLDNVVRRHGLADTVNDFDCVDLPPLSDEDAIDFILKLGAGTGLTLSPDHAKQMVALVGNAYPYFLQIFVAELDDALPHDANAERHVDEALIERVYRDRVVAGQRNKYLPHMQTRLDKILTPLEVKLAQAILRALCRNATGMNLDQITEVARNALPGSSSLDLTDRDYVLDVLKHDGYLLQEHVAPYQTRFFSNLLRDYWHRKHA